MYIYPVRCNWQNNFDIKNPACAPFSYSPLPYLRFLESIILKLISEHSNPMAKSIELWKEYISSDPTYQNLCDLKKKVRPYLLLPTPNKRQRS